jgi:signal transduction histidine kinase
MTMPIDAATTTAATAAPPTRTVDRTAFDRIVLPDLRDRVRAALMFLAGAQTIYAVTILFSQGIGFETRATLNLARTVILWWCVWGLRGEGSRRDTLAIQWIGLGAQFVTGILISIARQDAYPMVLLVVVTASITSVFIPWGGRAQAFLAVMAGISVFVAEALVGRMTGARLGFDVSATVAVTLLVTVYIAHFLEKARVKLEERLEEARRTAEELETLRAQLERRVAERTAELEMANRELEGFSYTVSHDLRSPLRAIAGFSQVILEESSEQLDESVRSSLTKIHAASRRMDGLIDDMLLLARVGRSALRYEAIDLADLADQIGEDLKSEHPERKVELRIDPVPLVRGDLGLLRIVLDNILRNAWKFTGTRENATVRVFAERNGTSTVIHVKDNGIGFDPRFRSKLFQPFERIHGDPRFPGTGVGLATVARIIRRHGGDVEAEGALDQGATFSFWLPDDRAA